MKLREDLERALEASRLYEVSGGEPTNLYEFQALAMDLLRYHGQVLVEAVRDAERWRGLKRHVNTIEHDEWMWDRADEYEGTSQISLEDRIDAAMKGENK